MDLEEQKQKESIIPCLEALMNFFFFFKFLAEPLGGGIKPTLLALGGGVVTTGFLGKSP